MGVALIIKNQPEAGTIGLCVVVVTVQAPLAAGTPISTCVPPGGCVAPPSTCVPPGAYTNFYLCTHPVGTYLCTHPVGTPTCAPPPVTARIHGSTSCTCKSTSNTNVTCGPPLGIMERTARYSIPVTPATKHSN